MTKLFFGLFVSMVLFVTIASNVAAANISGAISYSGTQTGAIALAAFDTPITCSPPQTANGIAFIEIPFLGSYSFSNLPNGTYYIVSVILTGGADAEILPTDPWGVYGGCDTATPVTISGGANATSIDFSLVDGTASFPNPFYSYESSVISGHSVGLYSVRMSISDPTRAAFSITATGPGIDGILNFDMNSDYEDYWEGWVRFVQLSSGDPPSFPLPLVYTITITDPSGSIIKTETVNGYVDDLATNLAPSGGEIVTGTPVFSWTIPDGQYTYGVILWDSDGPIWDVFDLTTTSVTYNGPPLTPGTTYYNHVLVFDSEDNFSEVSESFLYQGDSAIPFTPYDPNQDWAIGNFELLNAIDDWAGGGLGNFELLDLIDMWAFGSYCWDAGAGSHKAGDHDGTGACL